MGSILLVPLSGIRSLDSDRMGCTSDRSSDLDFAVTEHNYHTGANTDFEWRRFGSAWLYQSMGSIVHRGQATGITPGQDRTGDLQRVRLTS